MDSRFRTLLKALTVVVTLVVLCTSADASFYSFTQKGYAGGGIVSITFEGTDLNGDGRLTYMYNDPGEITDFTLTFSGDSTVGDFLHTLRDVYGIVYDIGSAYIGDRSSIFAEGIASNWGGITGFDYAAGWGPTQSLGGRIIDLATGAISSTFELPSFTTAPLPGLKVGSGATLQTFKLAGVSNVPLPGAVWLLGSGLVGLLGLKRKLAG